MTSKNNPERIKASRERSRALGFVSINLTVPEDEADLMRAEAGVRAADHIMKFVNSLSVGANGIEDERFDHLMDVRQPSVPTLDTVTALGERATSKAAIKDAADIKELLYGYKQLLIQTKQAEKRYEEASARDKYDAALDARLTNARAYAMGRLVSARVKLHKAKYERASND